MVNNKLLIFYYMSHQILDRKYPVEETSNYSLDDKVAALYVELKLATPVHISRYSRERERLLP